MAAVTASAIASALATVFQDKIVSQMNRSVVLLQLLETVEGTGQNFRWDADFTQAGTATDSSVADGADISTFGDDDLVPATLEYGVYQESFAITGKARAIARNSLSPSALEDLYGEKLMRAVQRLTKNIGADIYSADGTGTKIAGLVAGGAIAATGTYAGIARAGHTEWASNVNANGGTPRANTLALMRDTRRSIYNACGEMPDLIICDATQRDKYGAFFDGQRQYKQDVYLRGQKITLDGGYNALDFEGIPVIADVRCPAGTMLFLNTGYAKLTQLPDIQDGINNAMGQIALQGTAEYQFGERATRLTAMINPLARTGDYVRFQLKLYPQLVLKKPNSCASLVDLL